MGWLVYYLSTLEFTVFFLEKKMLYGVKLVSN